MRNYAEIGIQVPDVYLPKAGVDLTKWAVIACDQFTSQPEYWQKVEEITGNSPSTYHLILPEVYLGDEKEGKRSQSIHTTMQNYLADHLLVSREGMVLVERTINGKQRLGLVLALDLEQYDFHKGSQSLIRATEGTILERLPPRIKIRQGAPIELPHILVLIDDPGNTVIEPLYAIREHLTPLYDFNLMLDSGHLRGYLVDRPDIEMQVANALRKLANPEQFTARYGVDAGQGVLLFAVGDGNHSLATAKAIWENMKAEVGPNHPARYALVEIENVHDQGLAFEPIHRVLFEVKTDIPAAMKAYYGKNLEISEMVTFDEMMQTVNQTGSPQRIGFIQDKAARILTLLQPVSNLPVGSLQPFLDNYLKSGNAQRIDYVHGNDVVLKLGSQEGNAGFYLPCMPKSDLFKTVILDGALPRKTFSMGEALEKRFYMEARRIMVESP